MREATREESLEMMTASCVRRAISDNGEFKDKILQDAIVLRIGIKLLPVDKYRCQGYSIFIAEKQIDLDFMMGDEYQNVYIGRK